MKIISYAQNGSLKGGTPRYDYTFQFTFNSRATYLAHVADWKVRLDDYVAEVRSDKKVEAEATQNGRGYAACGVHNDRVLRRREARELLAERQAMKKEAQRQYLELKNAVSLQQS